MKLKKSTLLVSSAVAVLTLSGAVQAAILAENQTINQSHNLYYTGMAPLDRVGVLVRYPTDGVTDPGLVGNYYTGYLTALRGYNSTTTTLSPIDHDGDEATTHAPGYVYTPRVQPVGCPAPDTNRTCFGSPGKVIDLSAADSTAETTVYISVDGTVNGNNAAGATNPNAFNALVEKGLVAVWAKEDTSTNVTTPLTDLQSYKDTVLLSDNTTEVDQGVDSLIFLNEHPGFTQIGNEFLVVDGATATANAFTGVSVTKPIGATHLVLGYNGTRGEFTTASADEYSVSVDDVDPSGAQPAPVASVAVAGGTLTNGSVNVAIGTELTFTGSADYSGTNVVHSGYAWTLDTAAVGTDATTYAKTFNTAGTFVVKFTDSASAGDPGSKSVTVVVAAAVVPNIAPVANFTASNSDKVVTFTSAATDADSDTLTYSWNFGDSETSTDQNPVHTYAADGTYTVTLTVNDGTVDSDASSKAIVVTTAEVKTSSGGGAMFGLLGFFALFAPSLMRRRMK